MNVRIPYLETLNRLPIVDPTPADLAAVTPHLSEAERADILTSKKDRLFVGPPTIVKDGMLPRLCYSPRPGGRAILTLGYSRVDTENSSVTRARAYADAAWPENLISGPITWVIHLSLLDPSNPMRKACIELAVVFSESSQLLSRGSPETPKSARLDHAIVGMTTDPAAIHELRVHGFTSLSSHVSCFENCALCGGGLGPASCHGCGCSYPSNPRSISGWATPLSPKMVELLEKAGHTFSIDPRVAQEKERIARKLRVEHRLCVN